MSSCIALYTYCNNPNGHARWISLCVLTIGYLGFLDELSFLGRIIDMNSIEVYDVKLNQVHSLALLGQEVFKEWFTFGQSVVLLISVTGGMIILLFVLRKKLKNLYGTSNAVPFILASLLAILLATAIERSQLFGLIDAIGAAEEITELIAAWAIYCAAFIRLIEVNSFRLESKNAIISVKGNAYLPTVFWITFFAIVFGAIITICFSPIL
jgi:hypothetical protein